MLWQFVWWKISTLYVTLATKVHTVVIPSSMFNSTDCFKLTILITKLRMDPYKIKLYSTRYVLTDHRTEIKFVK
jgi:hypothetical protein